jgi:hypothetical protein
METIYADLKGKPIYKNIQQNLLEASKHYLQCTKKPLRKESLQNFHTSLEKLFQLISPIQQDRKQNQVENEIKLNFVTNITTTFNNSDNFYPRVKYNLDPTAELAPKLCPQSNGLDIPLQEDKIFEP